MNRLLVILLIIISGRITLAQGIRLKIPEKNFSIKRENKDEQPAKDSLKLHSVQYNYYDQLGAACKLEFNFEKATKVPLRVRLGSLQQTDYMEQKPNAIKPGL